MKFRVLSDLHVDYNEYFPFSLNDDIFTVLCGDTSGDPAVTVDWVKKNIKHGLLVSGNHLPYGNTRSIGLANYKTMQEQRQILANAFPLDSDVTYLDVETGTFMKEVEGVLFIGTCMYTDFSIKHHIWNPTGDRELNMKCSHWCMNDYAHGIISKTYPFGTDNDPSVKFMEPKDCFTWFKNAWLAIDRELHVNERSDNPKPVVIITHHPLITDYLEHNDYVADVNALYRQRDFNWSSYASNQQHLLLKHKSVKAYVCGHIHAVHSEYRKIELERQDGSKILVVNNARGYVIEGHDANFNPNRFIDTSTWTLEEKPYVLSPEKEKAKKDARLKILAAQSMLGMF